MNQLEINADATLLLPSSATLFTQSHKLVKCLMAALNVVFDNVTLDREGVLLGCQRRILFTQKKLKSNPKTALNLRPKHNGTSVVFSLAL